MPSPEASPTPDDATSAHGEHLQRSRPYSNLARGIVWADILAEIAADEQLRDLPDAA